MTLFDIAAILLTAAALGSYINYKWIKLPSSIGLLLFAMGVGVLGIFLRGLGLVDYSYVQKFLSHIDFTQTVFHGTLSFLLFAGALQLNLEDLKKSRIPIIITATVSTVISTFVVGLIFYFLANKLGFTNISFIYALLFGVILSPTDPIASLAIIRKMSAPKKIETTIVGESLFNDGVAIVFFLTLIEIIREGTGALSASEVTWFLTLQIGGGVLFGAIVGWIASRLLANIDDYHIELFITLAVATGGYALAEKLFFSAPIAMVIAGIIIGNKRLRDTNETHSKKHIEAFWNAIDEILNSILFLLIGLEMMVLNPTRSIAILAFACIGISLAARFISIVIPLSFLRPFLVFQRGTIAILTWGGLRGALSIAMVLSLSTTWLKDIFLPCIYFVVVFSIAVQGLTFAPLLKKYKLTKI